MFNKLLRLTFLCIGLALVFYGLATVIGCGRMMDDFTQAKSAILLRQEIDFSQKQELDFTLFSNYPRSAHGVKLDLLWQKNLTSELLAQEVKTLEGDLNVLDPQGKNVCHQKLSEMIPLDPSTRLAWIYIPLHERFPAHFSLKTPSPTLGKATLEARYALCGCEILGPSIGRIIGWVLLVFGLICTGSVIWHSRHQAKPAS